MFPYSWLTVFSVSILTFIFINSSWSSFFSSPLAFKKESCFFEEKDFWF